MQYLRLHSKRYRYFQITTNTSSIGCYFLAYFLTPYLGFLVCFSLLTPMSWGFLLAFFLPRPVSPRDLAISFRSGFSSLLFSSYAHAVGFSAHQFLFAPSFLPGTRQLASGLCFSACFSS